jgi:hypothetical protein
MKASNNPGKAPWIQITAATAITWAAEHTVEKVEDAAWLISFEPVVTLVTFTDNSEIAIQSEYEGPLSEVTPGNGIEPPTWWLRRPA